MLYDFVVAVVVCALLPCACVCFIYQLILLRYCLVCSPNIHLMVLATVVDVALLVRVSMIALIIRLINCCLLVLKSCHTQRNVQQFKLLQLLQARLFDMTTSFKHFSTIFSISFFLLTDILSLVLTAHIHSYLRLLLLRPACVFFSVFDLNEYNL